MNLVEPWLLEILRCPVCLAPLTEDEEASVLRCTEEPHEYSVEDGIPNMLPPEWAPRR